MRQARATGDHLLQFEIDLSGGVDRGQLSLAAPDRRADALMAAQVAVGDRCRVLKGSFDGLLGGAQHLRRDDEGHAFSFYLFGCSTPARGKCVRVSGVIRGLSLHLLSCFMEH